MLVQRPPIVTDTTALRYELCDRPVEVVTDDGTLVEPLRRLFPSYVRHVGTTPSGTPTITIRRAGGAYLVDTRAGEPAECRTVIDVMEACEFALADGLLVSCPQYTHLHAGGAVTSSGGAVLAVGRAGAGKSSLALAWTRRGWPALGDDVVLLDADGTAQSFRRFFKVNPALLAALGVEPATTPFWVPGSVDAWYDPADGAGWADTAPVQAVILARFTRNAPVRISERSSADGLNALLHSVLPSGRDGRAAFDALTRVAVRARVIELRFGDVAAAADAVAGMVA